MRLKFVWEGEYDEWSKRSVAGGNLTLICYHLGYGQCSHRGVPSGEELRLKNILLYAP
jgi:hypothetical protein